MRKQTTTGGGLTKYIALLRGINVGGHKLIKMPDLSRAFESAGMKNVSTYIQSGNVIFETSETDSDRLTKVIEKQLSKSFGYEIAVMLRTSRELADAAAHNPFIKKLPDDFKLYVTFLYSLPSEELVRALLALSNDNEEYSYHDREIYAAVAKNTKEKILFSNNLVEKKLKVSATTRNTATVGKLVELAQSK